MLLPTWLQDASVRGLPIASCLDIWGTVENPAGSPAKNRWGSRAQNKDTKAEVVTSKPARSR